MYSIFIFISATATRRFEGSTSATAYLQFVQEILLCNCISAFTIFFICLQLQVCIFLKKCCSATALLQSLLFFSSPLFKNKFCSTTANLHFHNWCCKCGLKMLWDCRLKKFQNCDGGPSWIFALLHTLCRIHLGCLKQCLILISLKASYMICRKDRPEFEKELSRV